MKAFKLTISTPIGKNYINEKVNILNTEIYNGQVGILANHAPLVSSLKVSLFNFKTIDGEEKIGVLHGGVIEVSNNEVTILTPLFDFADEVDVERTNDEIKNIEYQLQFDVKETEANSLNRRHIYAELKLNIAE